MRTIVPVPDRALSPDFSRAMEIHVRRARGLAFSASPAGLLLQANYRWAPWAA